MAPSTAPAPDPTHRTALVIGGGISGLLSARELAQVGIKVTLLERENHLGGAVGAHQLAGVVLDSGAESFATRTTAVRTLLEELGLGNKIVQPAGHGSWLYLPEGPFPSPSTGTLGIPGNLHDPVLKKILGKAGFRRAKLDAVLPRSAGSHAKTLGELVRLRMGQQVLDRLVTPVVSGVHSVHPDKLDIAAIAPGLITGLQELGSLSAAASRLRAAAPAGSLVAGIKGGMNQLSEALVDDLLRHRVRIVTGFDTIAVDRDPLGGWTAIQRQPQYGEKSAISRADLLVVATDAQTTIRLLGPHLPSSALPAVTPGPEVALVTLVIDQPALNHAPRGTGLLVSELATNVRAKALTHATAKWNWIAEEVGEGRHIVRLSYGRGKEHDTSPLSDLALHDDQLVTLALHDASQLMGVTISKSHLVAADVVRWQGALPSTSPGHKQRVEAFRLALEELPGATAVGAWIAGTGLAAVTADTLSHIKNFAHGTGHPTEPVA
ncbi:protoporphyrinogen oxidase [Rothia nasimurium]|uniref:protoporphyrinogen oxidase n=1 Tax=Rothia nasimurium TaxID=85336 RepID=UPI001EFF9242|nr:protoporphyrinogen oxidase [Rothia nasimurium]